MSIDRLLQLFGISVLSLIIIRFVPWKLTTAQDLFYIVTSLIDMLKGY